MIPPRRTEDGCAMVLIKHVGVEGLGHPGEVSYHWIVRMQQDCPRCHADLRNPGPNEGEQYRVHLECACGWQQPRIGVTG